MVRSFVGLSFLAPWLAPLLTAGLASAAFVTPAFRPADTTAATATSATYQEWMNETKKNGNTPDTANVNPNGAATVNNPSGNGYVTSTGHLYALNGPMDLTFVTPAYASAPAGSSTKFIVQFENDGSLLIPTPGGVPDYSGFTIDGAPVSSQSGFTYTELSRSQQDVVTPGGTFTTYNLENEFAFTVSGIASSHTFAFTMPANNSLAHVAVDTLVVTPEPAMLSLIAFGLPLIARRRVSK